MKQSELQQAHYNAIKIANEPELDRHMTNNEYCSLLCKDISIKYSESQNVELKKINDDYVELLDKWEARNKALQFKCDDYEKALKQIADTVGYKHERDIISNVLNKHRI